MSESEFGDYDRFGSVVDETFPAFIESIELVEHASRSESWAFYLEAWIEAEAHRESRMSEASFLVSTWELKMWASKEESRPLTSHMGQALLECDGYEMIRTKARRALTHLGPSLRAKSHSFDQETILARSAMSLVSWFLLHFSRRRDLSFLAIWSFISLGDGLLSLSDSRVRAGYQKWVCKICAKMFFQFQAFTNETNRLNVIRESKQSLWTKSIRSSQVHYCACADLTIASYTWLSWPQ